MSCPDWSRLVAHRATPQQAEPPEWQEALRHLEACGPCRKQAVKADPTLVFRRLPTVQAGPEEADAMGRAVAALRRGRSLEGLGAGWSAWRYAAAILLAVGTLVLVPQPGRFGPSEESTVVEAWAVEELPEAQPEWSLLPLVEFVEPPRARVYQLAGGDDDLAVVMIVDEALDV
jgi:hypothetical protein